MTALSHPDRDRLVKLLGLLGSDHAGERDAAALAAVRLLRSRKLDWSDVVASPAPLLALRSRRWRGDWRDLVAACRRQPGALRPWEVGFLRDLLLFLQPSPKQLTVLNGIAERLGLLDMAA